MFDEEQERDALNDAAEKALEVRWKLARDEQRQREQEAKQHAEQEQSGRQAVLEQKHRDSVFNALYRLHEMDGVYTQVREEARKYQQRLEAEANLREYLRLNGAEMSEQVRALALKELGSYETGDLGGIGDYYHPQAMPSSPFPGQRVSSFDVDDAERRVQDKLNALLARLRR